MLFMFVFVRVLSVRVCFGFTNNESYMFTLVNLPIFHTLDAHDIFSAPSLGSDDDNTLPSLSDVGERQHYVHIKKFSYRYLRNICRIKSEICRVEIGLISLDQNEIFSNNFY